MGNGRYVRSPVGGGGGSSIKRGGKSGVAPCTPCALRKRHRTCPVGRAALGASSPAHPFMCQLLANLLKGRPARMAGNGRGETHRGQALC